MTNPLVNATICLMVQNIASIAYTIALGAGGTMSYLTTSAANSVRYLYITINSTTSPAYTVLG